MLTITAPFSLHKYKIKDKKMKTLQRTNIKNSICLIVAVLFFISPVSLSANEEDLHGEKEKTAKESKTKNGEGFFKYSLEAFVQGGEVENYSLYRVSSPVMGGGVDIELSYEKSKKVIPALAYSLYGEKFFKPVEKSDYTLDSVEQNSSAGITYKTGRLSFVAEMNYRFVYRPDWPDLYQPDPYLYDAGYDLNNVKLDSTDRYSYHMYNPEAGFLYRIKKTMRINLDAGYVRKRGYEDRNFDPSLPGHLTPDNYSKVYGEISFNNFSNRRVFNYKVSNRYYLMESDEELSRDRVTGKTHYITGPNPLYKEWNNKTELDLILVVRKLNMKIRPFYAYRINTDTFQGYYSYTEHDFGIKFQQRLLKKKLKWSVMGERRLRSYTDDGYGYSGATGGHFPLTDGTVLYKNYWIVNLKVGYTVGRSLEVFGRYMFKDKDTNYPSYVPGVNPTTDITQPGTKNYDIDFSYTNQRFDLGVKYTL